MSEHLAAPESAATNGELGRWLEERIARGMRESQIVTFSVEAPLAAPEAWLQTGEDEECFAWLPGERRPAEPEDAAWVGSGATLVLEASGPERLPSLRAQATSRCSGLAGPTTIRWFGGLAFTPGEGARQPWEALGDACFVLPRLAYERRRSEARLHVAVPAGEVASPGDRRRLIDQLATRLARLAAEPAAGAPPAVLRSVAPDKDEFVRRVAEIVEGIGRGELVKLVTAAVAELWLAGPPRISDVLLRLREERAATRFAFRRGGACFVGASPELLIRRHGLEIATEAVAGSCRADLPRGARSLLSSPKDRREHALVVDALAQALGPHVERLSYPARPRVRRLKQLLHLLTPMSGRLREPRHVLALVEALHPTPAVGGTPSGRAIAAIAAREALPRGWYAAPFGWFDAGGDGAFAVALRSALIRDTHVHLFAGAGIVSDSEPAQEYDEIGSKLSTMKRALGVLG